MVGFGIEGSQGVGVGVGEMDDSGVASDTADRVDDPAEGGIDTQPFAAIETANNRHLGSISIIYCRPCVEVYASP